MHKVQLPLSKNSRRQSKSPGFNQGSLIIKLKMIINNIKLTMLKNFNLNIFINNWQKSILSRILMDEEGIQ